MNMKPGDAFILGGRTHLVVAVTTATVSVQSPDGVITEYTREKLTAFLCGPQPDPYQSPEELAKLIEAIKDLQRKEKDHYDPGHQPGYYPYYPASPYETDSHRREYERKIKDYVWDLRKKEKPEW